MAKNIQETSRLHPFLAVAWRRKSTILALFALTAILLHLLLRYGLGFDEGVTRQPLLATLVVGGLPLLFELLGKLWKREFGSDLLGGISIVTSVLLGDRLGAIYTPVALAVALAAWAGRGEATRFLAVLVIATPCPL